MPPTVKDVDVFVSEVISMGELGDGGEGGRVKGARGGGEAGIASGISSREIPETCPEENAWEEEGRVPTEPRIGDPPPHW